MKISGARGRGSTTSYFFLRTTSASKSSAILAQMRPVQLADARHVGGHVVGELDQRAEADRLLRIVEPRAEHRHAGAARDLPEAGLPVLDAPARAFGRQHEPHALAADDLLGGLLDDAAGRAAVHRASAEAAQQPA